MKKICSLVVVLISAITLVNAQIIISEINYRSASKPDCGDWIELHNIGSSAVNIGNYTIVDSTIGSIPYTLPANASIAAGGYLVLVADVIKFASIYTTTSNYVGPISFSLSKLGEVLTLRDAAVNIVCQAQYQTTFGWPKGADGEGRTLELINQNSGAGLMLASSWRDGCMLGSPGKAPIPCNDPIIFTEINYNSDSTIDQGEYVELHNTTATAINLTGYYLMDKNDTITMRYIFQNPTIIQPGGYLLVSNDTASLFKFHTKAANMLGNAPFNLKNSGELIRMFDYNDNIKFSVHYNDSIPWTDSADGLGYTLELKNKLGYMNDGTNWFAGCKGGSPGVAYSPICRPVAPLSATNFQSTEFNIRSMQNIYTISTNNTAQNLQASIINLQGQKLHTTKVKNSNSITIEMPTYLPDGLYLLQCTNGAQQFTFKIVHNN